MKDLWHYPRTNLAEQILGLFLSNLSSSFIFFAPRRMGKTEFLRKDIQPLAEQQHWQVMYFSFLDCGYQVQELFTSALLEFAKKIGAISDRKLLSRVKKIGTEIAWFKTDLELQTSSQDLTWHKIFTALAHKKKIFWVSSPQVKGLSNIEEVFLLGDQRYYNVHCPRCTEPIILKWNVPIEGSEESAGITWKLDSSGNLIKESVGYICQLCSGFFDSSHKFEMNINGFWKPTVIAKEQDHWSYQISSLYSPPGMDDWDYYVVQYLNANPPEQNRVEKKHQTFMNVVLGETYAVEGEQMNAHELQKNIANYEVGTVPEKLSISHGNGKIVLLTCAADLNGKEEDARLDYEMVAWSETGSSYSITHGSIGTFIPREGPRKKDRQPWNYQHGTPFNVWTEFNKVLESAFVTDTGRKMKIFITGIDCGYQTLHAYQFADHSNNQVVGLKGKDIDKYIAVGKDSKTFRIAREKANLYLVEGNIVKDELSGFMRLKYDSRYNDSQPINFMNFPTPSGGKYLFENYFSHFEAEHKVPDKENTYRWVKKNDVVQNHLFDCRVYNIVVRDILVELVCKGLQIKNYSWADYVNVVLNSAKK